MDMYKPSTTSAFNKLPIELNKNIVEYLDSDKDLCAFRGICRATYYAVDGDGLSFWRARFRAKWAYKEGVANEVLKETYQRRSLVMSKGTVTKFRDGRSIRERKVLRVLRDMIVESYQGQHGYDSEGRPRCPNQIQLIKFIENSQYFLSIKPGVTPVYLSPEVEDDADEKLQQTRAIQLMCAQFLLEVDQFKYDIFSFDDSQKLVYAASRDARIFTGRNDAYIDFNWLLHCLNFFRHHMQSEEVGSLRETIEEMELHQKPSAWRDKLKDAPYALPKYWKGTYSYLEVDELYRIRRPVAGRRGSRYQRIDDIYFTDKNLEHGGQIQSLELDFPDPGQPHVWPGLFEEHLHAKTPRNDRRTRAQHRSKEENHTFLKLKGKGDDAEPFAASGWLSSLPPQPQSLQIPGWQRITFMKYFLDNNNFIEYDSLWAYEGVVLPGGRLMFGRWWYAAPDGPDAGGMENSGPFIFWAVDPEAEFDLESDGDE